MNRYWIGGSGNWSDTNHWSLSSGGTGGASVPTSSDNVIIDANSFTGNSQTITVNGDYTCKSLSVIETVKSPQLIITAGKTLTVLNGGTAVGDAVNKITIKSSVANSVAYIVASGYQFNAKNCILKDISASGGAIFNAVKSTNNGGNTGWNFVDSVKIGQLAPVNETTAGLMTPQQNAKLEGIEVGATGDMTATEILEALKTVDGANSGLDTDLFDGKHASDFVQYDSNGKVGIGTASLTSKLNVLDSVVGNDIIAYFRNGDYTAGNRAAIKVTQQYNSTGNYSAFLGVDHDSKTIFLSNDSITANHLVINTNGNIGIGNNSLENWDSNFSVVQLGGNASLFANKAQAASNQLSIVNNAYFDVTTWKYISSDKASRYYQYNGTHVFKIAASGTADASVTWVDALVVDNSGNIGANTTPKSWHTNYSALQLGGNASFMANKVAAASGAMYMVQNVYYDGAWKFISADEGSKYAQFSGTHVFEVASAGVADGAVTWKTAMTIDNSGNIGIGTTDIESWSNNYRALQLGNADSIMFHNSTNDLQLNNNAYYDGAWKYRTTAAAGNYNIASGIHTFRVAASGNSDATITWTNAMTIDNGGKVGIGLTSPSGRLHVSESAYASTPIFERSGQTTNSNFTSARFLATKTTTMGNGFGTTLELCVRDDAAVVNTIASITAIIDGADNSGKLIISPSNAGVTVANALVVTKEGRVGIGVASPAESLEVNGNVKATQFIGTVPLNTTNFNKNLDATVNNVQKLADKVDDLETASILTSLKNTVTTNSITNVVTIGISQFNPATDVLYVYQEGVYIENDVEYSISGVGNSATITKTSGTWSSGKEFHFVVLKNIQNNTPASIDGTNIMAKSIPESAMEDSMQKKAGGVASLDENGQVPLSQLGNVGNAIYTDQTTNIDYKIVINNGIMYLEEV